MPTYKNETQSTISFYNWTWGSGETKTIYGYVPDTLGLTEIDPEPIIDPLLYVNESNIIEVGTPLEIQIPMPKLSPMYHLSISVSAGTLTLQFNDDSNNAVTINANEAFDHTIYWHIAPTVILTASVEATVTIIVSEMMSPIVY
jgi:hypothetical protein